MNGTPDTTLYDILNLPPTASKTEIKKAYHKAALSSHPDKVPEHEREDAEHKFKAVSQAYEILYDEDKRARYDRFGMADFTPGANGAGMDGEVDLEDLLNQMFMGGMGGMGGMPGMPGMGGMGGMPGMPGMPGMGGMGGRRGKGKDTVQEYEVSLEDLYKGKTVKMKSTRNVLCTQCKGTGGKPNAKPKKCSTCAGKGYTESLRQVGRGLVTKENTPCAACSSTGQTFRDRDRCRRCKGVCVQEEKKVLELYIPRGSKHGDKIVLEGEADEAPDQETGNIVFVLDEKEHDVFDRNGPDLSARMSVTLAEALTGFEKVVLKHLDGRGVMVKHPRGKVLRPGQVLRVKGEGMPRKKSDARGDLYLVVSIEFPKDGWSPDVERIRELLPGSDKEEVKAEQVDEVEYEEADMDEYGAEEGQDGGGWEDDDEDDEEGDGQPQCAQA